MGLLGRIFDQMVLFVLFFSFENTPHLLLKLLTMINILILTKLF